MTRVATRIGHGRHRGGSRGGNGHQPLLYQSVDEDYLYVFWISGVELRCEPVGDVYSKDLTQKWIQSVKYGKNPLTATEQCMLQILGEQEADNAELIKAWHKNAGETLPTTASSVPAIPDLVTHRAGSLLTPYGKPQTYPQRHAY